MLNSKELLIDAAFLDSNAEAIFVFGDNLIRRGTGGAAKLREHPKTYGFITKKYPNNSDTSFYKPDEYQEVFDKEVDLFIKHISNNPGRMFYIARIGGNLANKYGIWEKIIKPQLPDKLSPFNNQITFLWG